MEGGGNDMKVSYFREMKEHHLMITAGEVRLADYQMRMLRGNVINGLICPTVRKSDDCTEYDYLITGWLSLQTFVENEPLSEEVLRALVRDLCILMEEMDRFLVDGDYLSLRPEHIYLEKRGDHPIKVRYCLFPFYENSFEEQIRELFKYVINEVDYQDQSAVTLAYDLFQSVQGEIEPSVLKGMVREAKGSDNEVITAKEQIKVIDGTRDEGIGITEEILWAETTYPKEKKKQGRANKRDEDRKTSAQSEIVLPAVGKRGIIGLITKSRR